MFNFQNNKVNSSIFTDLTNQSLKDHHTLHILNNSTTGMQYFHFYYRECTSKALCRCGYSVVVFIIIVHKKCFFVFENIGLKLSSYVL